MKNGRDSEGAQDRGSGSRANETLPLFPAVDLAPAPKPPPKSSFEDLKNADQRGSEYWHARDLQGLLGYTSWRRFENAIQRAITSCFQSGNDPADHFVSAGKMVGAGGGAERKHADFHLSRFACYLIAQNGDPRKPEIADAQKYFAIQTRRQELSDQEEDALERATEEERRLLLRGEMSHHNTKLAGSAKAAGVITPVDYAIFQNEGYKGLYGGLSQQEIHQRKQLQDGQKILDHMGSTELAANLFRATQTEEKLRKEGIRGKEQANQVHNKVARKVRQTMADLGNTMPEDLPSEESINKLKGKKRTALRGKVLSQLPKKK